MIRLSKEKPEVNVVNDEVLTPTHTYDIATNSSYLIENLPECGIYHMSSEGECSWYEFAHEIFTVLNLKTPLNEISVKDMPLTVKRPFYSVLCKQKLSSKSLNFMPHWKDALRGFLKEYYLS
jgi:dTDP-4-dehydrorhamnose reductase